MLFVVNIYSKTRRYLLYNTTNNGFKELDENRMKRLLKNSPNMVVNAELDLKNHVTTDRDKYPHDLDRVLIKGSTGSFEKFLKQDKITERLNTKVEIFTVVNYFIARKKKWYTVVGSRYNVFELPSEKLIELAKEGWVINAKVISNKSGYFISGINWSIPMKEDSQELDVDKNNQLFSLLAKEFSGQSSKIDWESIYLKSIREMTRYFRSIYTGVKINDGVPANEHCAALPPEYDIVYMNEFEREYMARAIYHFRELQKVSQMHFSKAVNTLLVECLKQFAPIDWTMSAKELNAMLGILEDNI